MALLRRIAGATLAGLGQGIVQQAQAQREESLMRLRRKWQTEDRDRADARAADARAASEALTREGWDRADARAGGDNTLVPTLNDAGETIYTPRSEAAGMRVPGRAGARPSERQTAKDAEGYLRYLDDGSRVFPDAQKAAGAGRDKPPPGYRWTQDGTALEAIPGGPAAVKSEGLDEKAAGRDASAERQAELARTHIGEIRSMVSDSPYTTTGVGGRFMSAIPGTTAHDLDRRIDSLKAMIGFNALNEMRANSPTGGALGNVTERELSLLQSTIASLELSQSKDQFLDNLALVERQFQEVVHGPQGAGDSGGALAQASPVNVQSLPDAELRRLAAQAQANPDSFEPEQLRALSAEWRRRGL